MLIENTLVEDRRSAAAGWSLRLALFSLALLVSAGVLHRFGGLATPVAINLFLASLCGAVLAVLAGLVSLVVIWRRGLGGFGVAGAGMLLAGLQLVWPLLFLPVFLELPRLTDVSTDTADPPTFAALARQRGNGANSAAYPGASAAGRQDAAYPDLHPMAVDRGVEETFAIVSDTIRRLKWQPVAESAPDARAPGFIEAFERTLILGFYDDIVVRIAGDAARSLVDIRSSSRYGRHDLGRNAYRIRQFYRELQARLEVTGQGIAQIGRDRKRGPLVKRGRSGDQGQESPRKSPAASRSDAQRAPAPKARQP